MEKPGSLHQHQSPSVSPDRSSKTKVKCHRLIRQDSLVTRKEQQRTSTKFHWKQFEQQILQVLCFRPEQRWTKMYFETSPPFKSTSWNENPCPGKSFKVSLSLFQETDSLHRAFFTSFQISKRFSWEYLKRELSCLSCGILSLESIFVIRNSVCSQVRTLYSDT